MNVRNPEAAAAVAEASKYKWGFSSNIEQEFAPKGLSADTVRYISARKNEPEWMLDWRRKSYRLWQKMPSPEWAKPRIPPIDYQRSAEHTSELQSLMRISYAVFCLKKKT